MKKVQTPKHTLDIRSRQKNPKDIRYYESRGVTKPNQIKTSTNSKPKKTD